MPTSWSPATEWGGMKVFAELEARAYGRDGPAPGLHDVGIANTPVFSRNYKEEVIRIYEI